MPAKPKKAPSRRKSNSLAPSGPPAEEIVDPVKARREAWEDKIAEAIHRGATPASIARQVHPHDERRRQNLRSRIRKMTYRQEFHERLAMKAKVAMALSLGQVTEGVIERGKRGRIDAAKLLYEASGFHNPRVQHEHTGDIKIELSIPRPALPAPAEQAEPVVDADVVDD